LKLSVEEFIHPATGFNQLPSVYEIDTDEKVYTLVELDLAPALGGLLRRYQIIVVARDYAKAQFVEDMGLASLWQSGPKCVPSAGHTDAPPEEWIHCVSEIRDLANRLREIDMEAILEPEHDDLVQGYHDRVDEYLIDRKNMSTFGPLVSIERG